jgi:hypothetical protein
MNTRTAAVAVALASVLSVVAGCARPDQLAGAQSPATVCEPASGPAAVCHPVVAFGVAAAPQQAAAPRTARFEVDVDRITHVDPAGSPRR